MKPVIPLVKAATDPRLLGGSMDLWPAQLEMLASLEGPERTTVLCVARQCGKSSLAAMKAIHEATCRADLDEVLPPRRPRFVLVAAPSIEQSRDFIDTARGLIEDSPVLRPMAEFRADRITFNLPSGRRTCIQAMPANAKTVRGKSASLIVFEEFAFFNESAGPGSDERMFRALRPSLRRFSKQGHVLMISTPSGESGHFFKTFTDIESGALKSGNAIKAPAWEVDPSYDDDQAAEDREELGDEGFEEEVGAEFVSGRASWLDLHGVHFESGPALPEEGRFWTIGLDCAMDQDQFGVACVADSIAHPGRLIVGAVAALPPERRIEASKESLEEQQARHRTMLERVWEVIAPYVDHGARAVADQHKGGPVKSFLGRHGCPVTLETPGAPRDMKMFTALKTRLEDESLQCWSHPQLMQDLRRVRVQNGRIYLPRFRGSHCDAAVALASAVLHLRGVIEGAEEHPRAGPSLLSKATADLPAPTADRAFDRNGRRTPSFTMNQKF